MYKLKQSAAVRCKKSGVIFTHVALQSLKNLLHMESLRNLPYLGFMSERICKVDSSNSEGLKSPLKGGVIFPSTANARTIFKHYKNERKELSISSFQ